MISYNQALILLKKKCKLNVINHSLLVSKKSEELAKQIKENGYNINVKLCKIGGLLHDIGRSKTNNINHGVVGSKILKKHPLISNICKTHVGAGITKHEAIDLKIANEDLIPITLEEKVVCYADKLVHDNKIVNNADEEIMKLKKKLGDNHSSIKRLKKLENEINKFVKKV